jgi:hypothetical protein
MKKATAIVCGLALAMVGVVYQGGAAEKYETGFANVARLGGDLHKALEKDQKRGLYPVPLLLDQIHTPYIQPSRHFTGSNMVAAVYVSAGFIDLMNTLSHAMAINNAQKGYLKQYLKQLAQAEGAVDVQPVSNGNSVDISNGQISNFNQICGTLVAIDMAHHYLGHYSKYADQLGDRQTTPINTVVTPAEWRRAVLFGAQNALACGLGVEGIQYLFESINDMPTRPTWTGYFMPQEANVRKLNKELTRLQDCFFAGEKFKI